MISSIERISMSVAKANGMETYTRQSTLSVKNNQFGTVTAENWHILRRNQYLTIIGYETVLATVYPSTANNKYLQCCYFIDVSVLLSRSRFTNDS